LLFRSFCLGFGPSLTVCSPMGHVFLNSFVVSSNSIYVGLFCLLLLNNIDSGESLKKPLAGTIPFRGRDRGAFEGPQLEEERLSMIFDLSLA
jgi:hypothetical protein